MASNHAEPGLLERTSASSELGEQWRRLTRVATAMAFVTSPAVFVWLHTTQDWSVGWSLVVIGAMASFVSMRWLHLAWWHKSGAAAVFGLWVAVFMLLITIGSGFFLHRRGPELSSRLHRVALGAAMATPPIIWIVYFIS